MNKKAWMPFLSSILALLYGCVLRTGTCPIHGQTPDGINEPTSDIGGVTANGDRASALPFTHPTMTPHETHMAPATEFSVTG